MNIQYCTDWLEYTRRQSMEVQIGDVPMGGLQPIRVQSMTTVDTMDTLGSVEQVIRMVESGCEYVRITAPSVKEAQNLENIKKELRLRGINVPLVADIHFTPNAAELAARIVEKVRINPGNYADKKRFETIEYSDAAYQAELDRIRERFLPLIKICKEYGTAMRIGTNHGSLSDRIMSRYGDSPVGMVESALEFLKICEDENYHNIVLSMKSSNTQVMVQAYRLLVVRLQEENMKPYPFHLGVTEAGDGPEGRIKSALGIGTLLEDGIGDTVRVSLTEDPEFEAPVARALIDRYIGRKNNGQDQILPQRFALDPYQYRRRNTHEVLNIGGLNVPRVVADLSGIDIKTETDLKAIGHYFLSAQDKWHMTDTGADFVYSGGQNIPFMLPNGLKEIQNAAVWQKDDANKYPLFTYEEIKAATETHAEANFVKITAEELSGGVDLGRNWVLVLQSANPCALASLRSQCIQLIHLGMTNPVIFQMTYQSEDKLLHSATDLGGLLIDGLGDGLLLNFGSETQLCNETSFSILQAARCRMSKTEYISCPSCGRTLFDLQETTAMIRKRTDHLKGLKIGIMGCIVNGPGEMADADYGYVGMGKDKISLYRGQNVVKRSVSSEKAVDELIELIKEDNRWTEPTEMG